MNSALRREERARAPTLLGRACREAQRVIASLAGDKGEVCDVLPSLTVAVGRKQKAGLGIGRPCMALMGNARNQDRCRGHLDGPAPLRLLGPSPARKLRWLVTLLARGGVYSGYVATMTVDIESLYRAYGPMVLRRCRRLLRDEQKSLDAMHDVFVELLRRKSRLEDRGLTSLLLQTATNVSLNRIRSERRRPEDLDEELLFSIANAADAEAENHVLARRLVARLLHGTPASTRLIAVMHYVDGLSYEEVATEVGMSVSGVRKRLRTMKENLPALKDEATPRKEAHHG